MTIDKRWTTMRNRNSDEFWDGLNKFIEIAKEQADTDGLVRCPCGDCLNTLFHTPDTVHAHIYRKGFQQSYQHWVYHGEVVPPVIDKVAWTEVESQQTSSSSSSNGITVNEREIFQKVFGKRRGHVVGIGRKLKRSSGLPSSSTTSAPVSYETVQEMIRVTQEASDRHYEEQTRKWSQDFISVVVSQMVSNANVANCPPSESTPAPPFDYNAFMASSLRQMKCQINNREMMTRMNAGIKEITFSDKH